MLWARVLKQKYCTGRRASAINADHLPCSQVWTAMKRGREVFNKGSMWLVGRDSNQSFWFGNWIKGGPIRHWILGPLTCETELLEVKDMLTDSEEKESAVHPLRDCAQVRAVWLQLGVRYTNQAFWSSDLQEWLTMNRSRDSKAMYGKIHWSMLFSFAIWMIWKSRNQTVVSGKAQNPKLSAEIENLCTEFMYCASSPRSLMPRVVVACRWEKPPEGWIKLNTDGCSVGSTGLSGCGGVVRNSHGDWMSSTCWITVGDGKSLWCSLIIIDGFLNS
ncbi:hypothetical protein SO802_028616 [Lithocarpus litseifolius]|uniref:RNase H type-1 domain-containing protein n=1 Tax=Lithocarpus litseifolius TaxID=425828 RepID=A0AAW2BRB7_9ROSI